MNDGWSTIDNLVAVGESSDDEDSLVICIIDDASHIMTAILDRREIESLVEYMAEWVGFPLVISQEELGELNDGYNQ
jgi:hypothetical protein|tara:strand:- start:193 stop:423 length:231 start_codon:yes stop_codon:yes gene_type:complete